MIEPVPSYSERSISYHTVTLGEMTREGDVLAEITEQGEDGQALTRLLRIPAGLPGERVTIAVEGPPTPKPGRRKRHWKPRPPRAWITEIHEPSPERIEPACPVFGTCGGCQLQHMPYQSQITWKRSVVGRLLAEIGQFSDPPLLETVPCDEPWHYRNHMRFSVNRDGQPGLTARGSHRVLPLLSCPIADGHINQALAIFSRQQNPRPQVLVRYGTATGEMLVQPKQSPEIEQQLAEINIKLQPETMVEQMAGERFRIRPSSFFQTNTRQANKMAEMVLHGLLDGQDPNKQVTLADAYCGVGTFARLLAGRASKVIAIEESPSAITDAQWNLRDVENVEILKGKVEDLLPSLAHQLDGLVIDPPRAGCQEVVLNALIENPVSRIVYVSCDPSTLARDLHILCHLHPVYRLRSVQPLDMFPQTAHIESVTILERVAS